MQTIAELIKETVKLKLAKTSAELAYEEELRSLREQQANEVPIEEFVKVL